MNDKVRTLDQTRLLGFENVESEIDLASPELAGPVGAKVGEPVLPPEPRDDTLE
jgi:hypothetical protein